MEAVEDRTDVEVCVDGTSAHHWRIESPNGPVSKAICVKCKAEKYMRNSFEFTNWQSSPEEAPVFSRVPPYDPPVLVDPEPNPPVDAEPGRPVEPEPETPAERPVVVRLNREVVVERAKEGMSVSQISQELRVSYARVASMVDTWIRHAFRDYGYWDPSGCHETVTARAERLRIPTEPPAVAIEPADLPLEAEGLSGGPDVVAVSAASTAEDGAVASTPVEPAPEDGVVTWRIFPSIKPTEQSAADEDPYPSGDSKSDPRLVALRAEWVQRHRPELIQLETIEDMRAFAEKYHMTIGGVRNQLYKARGGKRASFASPKPPAEPAGSSDVPMVTPEQQAKVEAWMERLREQLDSAVEEIEELRQKALEEHEELAYLRGWKAGVEFARGMAR